MYRRGYSSTGTCAVDIYNDFDLLLGATNKDTHKKVVVELKRFKELADECLFDPDTAAGESGNFIVTLAGEKQFGLYEKAVLEAGLEHIKSFNNPRNGRENRMYGYFQPVVTNG